MLPVLLFDVSAARLEPCADLACDTLIVRRILDAKGINERVGNYSTETDGRLTELRLVHMELPSLPPEIGRLSALEKLFLPGNRLQELPAEVAELRALKSLVLDENRLASLPAGVGQWVNLETVRLNDNRLSSLPAGIGNWTRVKQLWVSRNNLASLPPEIGGMTGMYELWLDSNALAELPPEIGRLNAKLQRLDLRYNALAALPGETGELTNMVAITLSHNRLRSLPPEIVALNKLNGILIDHNRLCAVPQEIRAWIDKYSIAKDWMETQRLDDTHLCDGTAGLAGPGEKAGDIRVAIGAADGRITLSHSRPFSCSLFDLTGTRLFASRSRPIRPELSLPPGLRGVYLLRVEASDGIRTRKLVAP